MIRPGPVCCPEVYTDVPGKFHDDDDDESNWGGRIKPLLKNLQWMEELNGGGRIKPY